MRVLFDLLIAGFLLACSTCALMAFLVLWRSLDVDWVEDTAPEHRGRARTAAIIAVGWVLIGASLVDTAPWGRETALYVVGIGGLLAMVGVFLVLSWQTLIDIRRARAAARLRGRVRVRPRTH